MKFLVFLSVALFTSSSFADNNISIKISKVANASKDFTNVIMAGISGLEYCSNETTTIDTCTSKNNRSSCNFKTVCPSTLLNITVQTNTEGSYALVDLTGKSIAEFGHHAAGEFTATVPWSKICSQLMGVSDCSMNARDVLAIAIKRAGEKEYTSKYNFIVQISHIQNTFFYGTDENIGESLAFREGVDDYSLVPGDKKALISSFSGINNFKTSYAGRIVGFRGFYTNGGCSKATQITTSSPSVFVPIDMSSKAIIDNRILGLENHTPYTFMFGFEDETGNIGLFKDIRTNCVENQHSVIPHSK